MSFLNVSILNQVKIKDIIFIRRKLDMKVLFGPKSGTYK